MLDIVGFSRMMGRDDEATTERVVRFQGEVAALAGAHGGRVVDTSGDSVFARFDSIVAALECAAAIQSWLAKDDSPDRLLARIGLHFGDVLVHGEDLFGDGVNIAARLEQLAPPGGIAVSEVVFQEVGARLPFHDAGWYTLKNIDRKIRVHVVAPEHFGFPPAPVAADSDGPEMVIDGLGEGVEAVRDVAALVRERVAAKRALAGRPVTVGDGGLVEVAAPRTMGRVLGSGGFWLQVAVGALLVGSHPAGWTSNGFYPLLGAVLVAGAVGALARAVTGHRGFGALFFAGAAGVCGWLFFDGAVSRGIVWALAAAALGPAIAGFRRSG